MTAVVRSVSSIPSAELRTVPGGVMAPETRSGYSVTDGPGIRCVVALVRILDGVVATGREDIGGSRGVDNLML